MAQFVDLVGKRFNRLTVTSYAGANKWKQSLWHCLCDCGKTTTVCVGKIKRTKSCGCSKGDSTRLDLTGHVYGRLTVVCLDDYTKNAGVRWKCNCNCGNTVSATTDNLRTGSTTSCGCARVGGEKVRDLTGLTFGKLTAIYRVPHEPFQRVRWQCRCSCGKEVVVPTTALTSGNTTTCGCSRRDNQIHDHTGKRFGRLLVSAIDTNFTGNGLKWICQCDCGNIASVFASSLTTGNTSSCGCFRKETTSKNFLVDITGQRFGRLTAIRIAERRNKRNEILWLCKCDCGNETHASCNSLSMGNTKSCGCYKREQSSNALLIDLTGMTIRQWTVIERSTNNKQGYPRWLCRHANGRLKVRNGNHLRIEADDLLYFTKVCRTRIVSAFKDASIKKTSRTSTLLGCTGHELIAHIKSQFYDQMTLENHGSVWHIDHRIPLSSAKTKDELIALCHYANLQPLMIKHNLSKGDRLDWVHPNKQAINQGA